ncbi:LytR/AlgR family response regulator transcription factor [Fibrella aquatilis]|uniref:Response regulator transcription factor n=1 Tax=Fibrella aquatilis TaxID=2817059 RepID=A0A939G4X4_9BACT|nr:LytTR family DNA-binding domain-containing protein [Fibrella aquatilis]MBO0930081.1 response regulator transcription factor [Fibrella aquatilis]
METYRCLVVEDSESTALLIKQYLTELTLYSEVSIASTYTQAARMMLHQPFDLIFLDVELNGTNSLDLLNTNRRLPPVVVMSAHNQYAVDCYDMDVADFLPKPFTKSRFLRGINRAMGIAIDKESVTVNESIFLKVGRRLNKFSFDSIDYVEAYGIYSKIHSNDKIVVVNEPIMVLEKRLPNRYFRRVHKSFIVNLNHISSYSQNTFYIDEMKIPIGISYRDDLPNIFNMLG